jgi:hypothetical protein
MEHKATAEMLNFFVVTTATAIIASITIPTTV